MDRSRATSPRFGFALIAQIWPSSWTTGCAEEASGRLAQLRRSMLGSGGGRSCASARVAARSNLRTTRADALRRRTQSSERARRSKIVRKRDRVIATAARCRCQSCGKRGLAPPSELRTAAFFRAQIEAAKDIKGQAAGGAGANVRARAGPFAPRSPESPRGWRFFSFACPVQGSNRTSSSRGH